MKRWICLLLGMVMLVDAVSASAQEYYTLPEIREQATTGWHETYIDKYGRETVVDIDVEVFGTDTAAVLKIGQPEYVEYSCVNNNPFMSIGTRGGKKTYIYDLAGEKVELDKAYGMEYGNDLELREAYAFLTSHLSEHGIPAEGFLYDRPEIFAVLCNAKETGEVLDPAFYYIRLWPKLYEMPVMASAMESFGKPGWPDFKPLLMYRMRNTDEYTITVRTCEEQEMIATDIPLCSLEQVLRNIEKKIEEGYIQEVISLSFGYSIYNDPAIQSKTPLAITDVKSYYAVPSWVLKCKFMKNPKKNCSDRTSATCLTINAQTGELLDYFDKSKFGFADADYKGFIPWDKVQ